jgi:hypothetical protein
LVPDFKVDRPEYAGMEDSEIVPDDILWDSVSDYLLDFPAEEQKDENVP